MRFLSGNVKMTASGNIAAAMDKNGAMQVISEPHTTVAATIAPL